MVKIRNCVILIFVLFASCESVNHRMTNARLKDNLKIQKSLFQKYCVVDNLFDEFPKNICSDQYSFFSSPPSVGASCAKQRGITVLKYNTDKKNNILLKVDSVPFLYDTYYFSDSNCIISLDKSSQIVDSTGKYNVFVENCIPIPCFEKNYIFSDSIVSRDIIHVDHQEYPIDTYYVPKDLEVFVLSAESGNFWKKDCGEYRPESLKEWKNGYSGGFAVSEKENIVVYWTMVW